jgi:hypothetical protein
VRRREVKCNSKFRYRNGKRRERERERERGGGDRKRERGTSENYATFQKALMQIYV